MKSRTLGFPLLVTLGLAGLAGCEKRTTNTHNPIDIMSGFVFVGTASHVRPEGLDERLPFVGAHGFDPLGLPNQIEPHIQYIFHKPLPVDDEKLALKVFPNRMKQAGMKMIGEPSITYFVEGGPLFRIEFEYRGSIGLLFNYPDPRLREVEHRSEWSEHDYVLVLMK